MIKSKISMEDKFNWWSGILINNDVIELAITKAYRDLMRTIRGFAKLDNHDLIITKARITLKKEINNLFEINITNQEDYDKWHMNASYKLIESFSNQFFTVGQAQKWINMTLKYLHLLNFKDIDKVYEYCHIPIDNYILNITNYKLNSAWSKLNDYYEYLEFQNWFRNKYEDEIPLDKEFYLWLEEVKNRK